MEPSATESTRPPRPTSICLRSMPLRFMPSYWVWLEVSKRTTALPRRANDPSAVPGRLVSCG